MIVHQENLMNVILLDEPTPGHNQEVFQVKQFILDSLRCSNAAELKLITTTG
jgi:hypothetical protein